MSDNCVHGHSWKSVCDQCDYRVLYDEAEAENGELRKRLADAVVKVELNATTIGACQEVLGTMRGVLRQMLAELDGGTKADGLRVYTEGWADGSEAAELRRQLAVSEEARLKAERKVEKMFGCFQEM